MVRIQGKSVSGGVAIGPAFVLPDATRAAAAVSADPETELRRIDEAIVCAQAQLDELRGRVEREAGEDAAAILEVQRLMLEDPDYREMVRALVKEQGRTAEAAVRQTGGHFARTFAESGDDCLVARAADVRDVSNRLVACLGGAETEAVPSEPSVLVAEEIVPTMLVRIDRRMILATVSRRGSADSHASILARALGIPAVANASVDPAAVRPGTRTLVDGTDGCVVFDPDERTENAVAGRSGVQSPDRRTELVGRYSGKLELCVNISGPDDLAGGLPAAFAGIGLFRTEFLYLGRPDLPDEEEQYGVYRTVLDRVGGRRAVVRTFDLGADKAPESLPCPREANPALGCRGIRLALAHPEVFKVQLRALLRAAACGDLRIMYPMITSCEEVVRVKALVTEAAAELERAGVAHRIPSQGLMIETPAAALISDELARMAEFLSIGTNDLTQYTLAQDREGEGAYSRPCHPAVLKLIRLTAENAHAAGIPVSICGELAADPELAETFLGLRIDSLSV